MIGDRYALPIYLGMSSDGTHVQADLAAVGHLLVSGDEKTSISRFLAMLRIPWCQEFENTLRVLKFDTDLLDADIRTILDPPRFGKLHMSVSWEEAYSDLQEVCREMERRNGEFRRRERQEIYIVNRQVDKNGKIALPPQQLVIITELEPLLRQKGTRCFGSLIKEILQRGSDVGIHVIAATANQAIIPDDMKSYFPAQVVLRTGHPGKQEEPTVPAGVGDLNTCEISYLEPRASDSVTLNNPFLKDPDELGSINNTCNEEDLLAIALEVIRLKKRASLSVLQRSLHIKCSRSVNLMNRLEEKGLVGPANDDGPREIMFDL